MTGSLRGAAFRPVWALARVGLRVEDELRRTLTGLLAQALRTAIARTLRGELVDVVAHDVVRYEVVERVSQPLLAGPALERVLELLDAAAVPQRIAEQLLADGIAEQVAARLMAGPELPRMLELALESPGVERMLTQIIESRVVDATVARVVDETVARLPSSESMWLLIDEIAASPAVTDAITQQSAGFADEMAGRVRDRSKTADARLERFARGLLRRRARDADPGPTTTPAT
jgi:hypothetical protein